MKYSYLAYTKSGSLKEGVIEASKESDASEQLRKQGLFVSTISAGDKAAKKTSKSPKKSLMRVHPKIVASFARELAVLVSTGTPLIDAISSIERQSTNESWAQVLTKVRTQLEEGDSFCAALESQRGIFDAVFRSLVAAGESSGNLDTMLLRVSVLTRKQAQIRASILGAMMYPILLVGVALIVMGLLIGVVLPRFRRDVRDTRHRTPRIDGLPHDAHGLRPCVLVGLDSRGHSDYHRHMYLAPEASR